MIRHTNSELSKKLLQVESAITTLRETKWSKAKQAVVEEQLTRLTLVKENIIDRLNVLKEVTTVPTTVDYKDPTKPDQVLNLDPNDKPAINTLKKNPKVARVVAGDKQLEEETGKRYTAEESTAVGKAVAKSLLKVLRAQGDEVVNLKLTGIDSDKFNIYVQYGNDKGADTFKFDLNPEGTAIILDLGNEPMELVDFVITQGNTVSLPTPELEDKLSDAMKKYVGEPSNDEYDQIATQQFPDDESQINKFIAERKLALRESLGKDASVGAYVKDFEKSKAPQFKGKSKEKRAQMGVAAALQAKDKTMKEDLDIGHEDNEPNMLKGDLYKLMKNAASLYKAMQALEGQGEVDFPQWWQGKILKASDDIQCAKEYLEFEMEEPAIDAAVNTLGEETVNEIVFDIKGLGTYRSTKQDVDTITGVDNAGTVKTFSKRKIALDNPGIFDKQPREKKEREKKEREKKPQGVRPYTEAQYRKVLQGAIDDTGSTEFAYDIADSMIYDPQILARLKKDYPGYSVRELKQQLQWDLEACDSPEDDYDDDYEGEVAEAALNEKKATYCGKCGYTHVKGTPCPKK